jgi:nuclease S1
MLFAMSRRIALVIALVIIPVAVAHPHAWGAEGHHVVARIAETRLTPETQRAIAALLGDENFVTISTWADEVRSARPETYNWHFVDVPYGQPHYDAARDCKPSDRGDCVIAAIDRLRRTLADTTASASDRRDALKFIVHFVGDLHQPLHTIENHDRGGNDVKVNGDAGRTTNLHSIWDSGALSQRGLDENAYTQLLLDDLKAHPLPASEDRVDVVKWAEDGHKVAEADVYRYAEFTPSGPPASPISLDAAYIKRAQGVIDRQLKLGGVHLAALLNETLGKSR